MDRDKLEKMLKNMERKQIILTNSAKNNKICVKKKKNKRKQKLRNFYCQATTKIKLSLENGG